ncbi:MAG TPA: TraB/GumN family protein [Bacteroidia bacterium]
MNKNLKTLFLLFILPLSFTAYSQTSKQKGLLWQVTGNGLKKPSYVYGTMHVSQKIAFHLGDSFYLALSKSDVVALEQDLDSVIHKWISENIFTDPENLNKVYPRVSAEFLGLFNFTLSSYNKNLLKRKLSAEVREVNYLLQRGDQDDFEEDAWLDLYIYQIAKKLGKGFTGVEGYEESRDLVKKSQKEPKDAKKKKLKRYNYKLRQQVAESYRKGDIFMIDSIDRMTESDHYLEYMLYKRNANMVRRMDSIMRTGKTLFTGVGCSHLPGNKGVLQMLIEKGYKVRPVQSIALEKSQMAKKYEEMKFKHKYATYSSEDGLISASLPTRLTRVNITNDYSSYLSPDLANGHYYQIEKISCNSTFSGQTPEDVLMVIDTMIFENIPGEIKSKKNIVSNGFMGMEVVTELKTGDLNRFQILASPFNVYIIRMSAKKDFAVSSQADKFFKSIKINEGRSNAWKRINSPDSIYSLELPTAEKGDKLPIKLDADPSFEYLVYENISGNTYLIKQLDLLNMMYLEQDTFELDVMARSFSKTDNFSILSTKHIDWQGYHALDAEYLNKFGEKMYARFAICGTRYIMFLLKPNGQGGDFNDRFFTSIKFNGKPKFTYFEYKDTTLLYKVQTPVQPMQVIQTDRYMYDYGEDEDETVSKAADKYKNQSEVTYYSTKNTNEFIEVFMFRYGYYASIDKKRDHSEFEKHASLKRTAIDKSTRNGIEYNVYHYTDTNTSRKILIMETGRGQLKYFIHAFVDTVSGSNEFVQTFFKTFDISDTLVEGNLYEKKGYRFFQDFTSKDSVIRKSAIKYVGEIEWDKKDIKNLCNVIDSVQLKGDAGFLRSQLLFQLSLIDSAQDQIVPYLAKLYNRFSDTAYMQIEILQALARQRCDKAFNAIKPILANDVPISSSSYEMSEMLNSFGDSLKLTKTILPELIELTNLIEYRSTAYEMITKMKDSGIINENDYASLHNRLAYETKIEYKRVMASLTNYRGESEDDYQYNYYEYGDIENKHLNSLYESVGYVNNFYNSNYNSHSAQLLADILDLSLPLRNKNKTVDEIVSKILNITDNSVRLDLIPVLLKYKIDFHDSVYEALAKNKKTTVDFYETLSEAKKLEKFPMAYRNQAHFLSAQIESNFDEDEKLDTMILIQKRLVIDGKDSGYVYVYKYLIEENETEMLFISKLMNQDSTKLYAQEDLNDQSKFLRYYGGNSGNSGYNGPVKDNISLEQYISDYFFKLLLKNTRQNNGGWYYGDYDYNSYGGDYDDYDY